MSRRVLRVPGCADVVTTRRYLHCWGDAHPRPAVVYSGRFGWQRSIDPLTGRWRGPWQLAWSKP